MRETRSLGVLAGLLVAPALGAGGSNEVSAELSHRVYKDWSLVAPIDKWATVDRRINVPHLGGDGFIAYADGVVLMVDTDGDGKAESKVKGVGGSLTLQAIGKDGRALTYGVRFRAKGKDWEWAASGAMVGKVNGHTVQLIDLDHDGRYDGIGKDGIIVGSGRAASFLSKVVNLDNSLFELEVNAEGSSIKLTPYAGETGSIDIAGSFTSRGKLESVVLNDESGKLSFNAVQAKGPLTVPVGRYRIAGGLASKGKETARILGGTMKVIEVTAGSTATLAWGSPITAEFTYSLAGNKLTVPTTVRYFGKAGEEYADWLPDNKSPKFLVYESGKKRPVLSGRFGSC